VNRWAHGYAYSYSLSEGYHGDAWPHLVGRARFGRIAVANSDAGAEATLDSTIVQAHRAVSELA
jgi:spermidine dehydrogenase